MEAGSDRQGLLGAAPITTPLVHEVVEPHGCSRASAVVSLCATAMGTGILALPISVYYCGFVVGTAMLFFVAVLSDLSLLFLVRAAVATGAFGYAALAEHFYAQKGKIVVAVSLLLLLLGGAVGVLIVIGDLTTKHLHSQIAFSHSAFMFLALCLVSPLCLFQKLSALSATSAGALLAVLFVSACLVVRFGQHGVTSEGGERLAAPASVSDIPLITLALPIQSLAYCCQFNVIEIYEDLAKEHKPRIASVVHASMLLCACFYSLFGVVGYLMFGDETKNNSNILTAFRNDTLIDVASVCVLFTNLFKFPLLFLPLRSVFNSLVPVPTHKAAHVVETALLCAFVFVLAVLCGDLGNAFRFLGCTVGVFVCFVVPGLFYEWAAQEVAMAGGPRWRGGLALSCVGVLLGMVSLAACVYDAST